MTKHEQKRGQRVTRRELLGGATAFVSLTALSGVDGWTALAKAGTSASGLFALGVASGDPSAGSVTLWTRLTRDPLQGGGMSPHPVLVTFEVAEDEHMRKVVRSGLTLALARDGHAVHVRVAGLRSDRWYYYRFCAQGEQSRIGRTRTFPAAYERTQSLRFAVASCQDYQNGFFSAYRAMANEDLDFVLHVGDYIYEDGTREGAPRTVPGSEIITLDDYRNRYAVYRLDPALQEVHALFPFVVTWDDHEVDNNYAGTVAEDAQTPEAFLARRTAAYRAYYEHMPLVPAARPRGVDMRLYRQLSFGNLASFNVLDTRQFRSDQPCGDGFKFCPGVFDQQATMLGQEQMRWLERSLRGSSARWNVLAQQVMMTKWDGTAITGFQTPLFNVDAWDGYQAAREHLLGYIAEQRIANPIVLSGDIHSSWVADLKRNYDDAAAPVVASEFVGTSITSEFPASAIQLVEATLPSNPHIRFFDGAHRGYLVCDVSRREWSTAYRAVSSILEVDAPVSTLATFVVEEGRPGAQMG